MHTADMSGMTKRKTGVDERSNMGGDWEREQYLSHKLKGMKSWNGQCDGETEERGYLE